MRLLRITIAAATMLFSVAIESFAQPITVPTGLNPGDQYRLAFVTSTSRDGTSPSIGVYNAFVSAAASSAPELAALGTTWMAIASTLTEPSARDNTGTDPVSAIGVPIYRLDDTRLANDNADLWDGQIAVPLDVDENGVQVDSQVWTGTNSSGLNGGDSLLGANQTNPTVVHKVGKTTFSTGAWLDNTLGRQSSVELPLYALSDILTVAPEVPMLSPSALWLLATLLAGFGSMTARRAGHEMQTSSRHSRCDSPRS